MTLLGLPWQQLPLHTYIRHCYRYLYSNRTHGVYATQHHSTHNLRIAPLFDCLHFGHYRSLDFPFRLASLFRPLFVSWVHALCGACVTALSPTARSPNAHFCLKSMNFLANELCCLLFFPLLVVRCVRRCVSCEFFRISTYFSS